TALRAPEAGRLDGVRHRREPGEGGGSRGALDRRGPRARDDLQPEAADEEALGGGRALPRDHRRGAGRRRLPPSHETSLSRPRRGDGLSGAPRGATLEANGEGETMRHAFPVLALAAAGAAYAGGSNYNVAPGTLPTVQGHVTEWS